MGAFLPCSLSALAPLLWLCASWFQAGTILVDLFSPTGRKNILALLVSGCLPTHCCSLNSAHVSGSNVFTKSLHLQQVEAYLPGPWLSQQCPCIDLLVFFMRTLVPWCCFPPPLHLLLKPGEHRDCSLPTYSGPTGPPWLTGLFWFFIALQTPTELLPLLSSLASGLGRE